MFEDNRSVLPFKELVNFPKLFFRVHNREIINNGLKEKLPLDKKKDFVKGFKGFEAFMMLRPSMLHNTAIGEMTESIYGQTESIGGSDFYLIKNPDSGSETSE